MTPQRPRTRTFVTLPGTGVPCPTRTTRGALIRAHRFVLADLDAARYWLATHEDRKNTEQWAEYTILVESLATVAEQVVVLATGTQDFDNGAMLDAVDRNERGLPA